MPTAAMALPYALVLSGSAYLGAILYMSRFGAPLGSPRFFAVAAVAICTYGLMLRRIWRDPQASRRLLWVALGLALLFRLPLAVKPVGPDNDMVRYLWDGRVQLYGYNPYDVIPADPALAHTHTEQTAAMPSRKARTPYPPGAQLFFRLVAAFWNSTLGMKLALLACDLLTVLVVWRWLAVTGRSEWLVLAYAWNPLVVLEVAHSGHVDALSALWIAAAAYWLARRRTALASAAFVLAVTTKLLPIVIAPLFIGRVRIRDIAIAAALLVALYAPFTSGFELPLGAVPNVVEYIRFNSLVFRALAWSISPQFAAAFAIAAGMAVAIWARWRLPQNDPAAWAWPMAIALLAAPVIYPWYLLPLTPFLAGRRTLPLIVWTISVIPVYVVWHIARGGGIWMVPIPVLVVEYGALLAACAFALYWSRQREQRHSYV